MSSYYLPDSEFLYLDMEIKYLQGNAASQPEKSDSNQDS